MQPLKKAAWVHQQIGLNPRMLFGLVCALYVQSPCGISTGNFPPSWQTLCSLSPLPLKCLKCPGTYCNDRKTFSHRLTVLQSSSYRRCCQRCLRCCSGAGTMRPSTQRSSPLPFLAARNSSSHMSGRCLRACTAPWPPLRPSWPPPPSRRSRQSPVRIQVENLKTFRPTTSAILCTVG